MESYHSFFASCSLNIRTHWCMLRSTRGEPIRCNETFKADRELLLETCRAKTLIHSTYL